MPPAFLTPCLAAVVMLACARLGAVHSVVFGGFSAESLAQRCIDCRCPPRPLHACLPSGISTRAWSARPAPAARASSKEGEAVHCAMASANGESACGRRSRVIITASGSMRGAKRVDLKKIVDAAAAAAAQKGHKVRTRAPGAQPQRVSCQRRMRTGQQEGSGRNLKLVPHAGQAAGPFTLEACVQHGGPVSSRCRPSRLGIWISLRWRMPAPLRPRA
jgi:hypothetical protein